MKLQTIILVSSVLAGCAGAPIPKVTLHRMFPEHGVAVPWEITKYNSRTCKLEGKLHPNVPITSMKKFVAISQEDYEKLENFAKTECENNKQNATEY